MTPKEHAQTIVKQLNKEQLKYAVHKDRGEYRGFAALHALFDANELLTIDEEETVEQLCKRGNAVTEEFNKIVLGQEYVESTKNKPKAGEVVGIYEKPITREGFEGKAKIIKVIREFDYDRVINALVHFEDDEYDENYERVIYYGEVKS